ncbi:hypothetical protein VPH35_050670 [Triticum aestivum]|uniref:Hypothetical gene predicted by FGENESH n=1 Tax=Triticum aestivum TaxID=4565 RepID=B4ERW2_WHEAT|nr:unnamed protein product [Triticum aestivum]
MCAFVRSDLILLHSWDGKGLYLSASTLVHPGVTDPDTLEACREGIALGLIKRYHIAMDCLNVVKDIAGGCIWCTEDFSNILECVTGSGAPVAPIAPVHRIRSRHRR